MTEAIRVHTLSYGYHRDEPAVLIDVSLDVPEGKITAILGPNGAGKTTLLHLMLGVIQPDGGQIAVKGKEHRGYTRRERSQIIGLVAQFESIPFNFSVLEYLLLGRSPYMKPFQTPREMDFRIAREVMATMGIEHLSGKPVTELSGGERQLVHLARALTQQTEILLLDEPTAHLDLENQNRILGILKGLSAGGKTVVLTTHDPNVALFAAENFVLLKDGRIFDEGGESSVITAANLSSMYNAPIRVETADGQRVVFMDQGR